MKIIVALFLFIAASQASFSTVVEPLNPEAVRTFHVLQNIVQEAGGEKLKSANTVRTEAVGAAVQQELKPTAWQDTVFRAHHNSGQHFLICATDKELFKQYLGVLMRLLQVNPHCRVTFVAEQNELDALRRKLYVLIRANVKSNHEVLRNLHVVSQPFDKIPQGRHLSLDALNKDKYSAIFLSCPRSEYAIPLSWLRNQNAVIYVPFSRDPDNIIAKLKEGSSIKLSVVKNIDMICAATTDQTKFLLTTGCLGYNPSKCPPINIDEVRDNLVKHDCKKAEMCIAGRMLLPEYDRGGQHEVFLETPVSSLNNHL